MPRVRVRRAPEITLPKEAWQKLGASDGDYIDVDIVEEGVFLRPDEEVERHCYDLALVVELISDLPNVQAVERDPNDDMIVATALKARADYLVTRDNDLLSLGVYEGIKMITPEAFMGMLREEREPRD